MQEDPTLLLEPNHVILNHLYALSIKVRQTFFDMVQSKPCSSVLDCDSIFVTHTLYTLLFLMQDNVLVLAATHRYKQKYVTTLMYKPI